MITLQPSLLRAIEEHSRFFHLAEPNVTNKITLIKSRPFCRSCRALLRAVPCHPSQRSSIVMDKLCLFGGCKAPASSIRRKTQSPGGLAALPLVCCLCRTSLAHPIPAWFSLRYELFSMLFMLHLPKELGARWFSCRGYNFMGEKQGSVKQSVELVAPQLLQGLPAPFLESDFCSLKAEISIAADALPGTLAGLLSLGCSSRNHRSFSLSFVIKARGALCFPCTSLLPPELGRAGGQGCSSDPRHQRCEFEKLLVMGKSKPWCPQENTLQ